MSDLFQKATREKVRYSTGRGQASVEDLWDMSLAALDRLAIAEDKKVNEGGTKSFIGRSDAASRESAFRLDVLKAVINTLLVEKEVKKSRAENAAQKETLKGILAGKEMEEIKKLTPEEIKAKIAALS